MSTRTHLRTLVGSLLLVPLIALTACEGYEQPGEEEAATEQEQTGALEQEQARPGQQQEDVETRQQRMETETQRQQQETDPEARTQRREAETETRDRPERPASPTAGEPGAAAEMMSMTEFSVQIPQDLSSGTYTLSCPVPESARRQQAGQEARQPTREDVQLRITVRQGQQGQQEQGGTSPR